MGAQQKWALVSRADEKSARVAKRQKLERDVHKAIDARDKLTCRATGTRLHASGGLLSGIHRHHVLFRSQGGETSTANMCLLSPSAHADVHAGRLVLHGNADKTLWCEDTRTGRKWISLPPGIVVQLNVAGPDQ